MHRFNPEKELSKIKNGNKKKIISLAFLILIVSIISYSFALYQVRHSNKLVYTTVKDFKKRDIYLSVLVDGKTQNDFPKNNEGKIYSGIECDKEYSEAYFDNIKWELHFTSKGPNKCTVKFETGNLPNPPELYQGMIPVVFSDTGIMYVADTNSDWYNYQDHRWANAVLVDASNSTIKAKYFDSNNKLRTDIAGIQIPMEEVLQMYVWIPRYKYQLWNVNNESKPKQIINIKFEKGVENTGDITCTYENQNNGKIVETCLDQENNPVKNGDWYTHPAFKFGNTDLTGIWVGKFEPSDVKDVTGYNPDSIEEISIIPNKISLVNKTVKVMFDATRNIETNSIYNLEAGKVNTHVMNNMEWGVVAYLSQSRYGIYDFDGENCTIDGCNIYINNRTNGTSDHLKGTITGCAGSSANDTVIYSVDSCLNYEWNTINGMKASTTGNMYGIYDMVGGVWEYVMGNIANDKGMFDASYSGFSTQNPNIDQKYYILYTNNNEENTHERGYLGDATRETLNEFGNLYGAWNNDYAYFPTASRPWFLRGGRIDNKAGAGIFSFHNTMGGRSGGDSFRIVLTAQDGTD